MKVFTENKKEKDIAVALQGRFLVAVDSSTGKRIAILFDFVSMRAPLPAKYTLARAGYRTDFAKWDDAGCMTTLLESFE